MTLEEEPVYINKGGYNRLQLLSDKLSGNILMTISFSAKGLH